MKNGLMEKISLGNVVHNTKDLPEKKVNEKDIFSKEKIGVETSKRLVMHIFHEALCEFGQDLKHEQQLSEGLADMFTYLYTSESVICRAQQTLPPTMTTNIVRINVAESILEINTLAIKCLNRIFSGHVPTKTLDSIRDLQKRMQLNTDTMDLKRSLAEYILEKKVYPF